jgi:hypothetical protein
MKMTMTMTNDSDMIMKCHQKIAMTMAMTNDSEIIVKCHQKIPMTVTPSFPWQAMHTHFFSGMRKALGLPSLFYPDFCQDSLRLRFFPSLTSG